MTISGSISADTKNMTIVFKKKNRQDALTAKIKNEIKKRWKKRGITNKDPCFGRAAVAQSSSPNATPVANTTATPVATLLQTPVANTTPVAGQGGGSRK